MNRDHSITGAGDPYYRRRQLITFAVAFALLEIVAGLWPSSAPPPPKAEVVAMRITVVKRTPPPTPVPTPRITPPPHPKVAPRIEVRSPSRKAAAPVTHKLGGAAAHKRIVHVKVPPPKPHPAPPVSVAEGTHLGHANGGTGTGGGPGAGTGGLGGPGAGQGNTGNGTGGDSDTSPCGVVDLVPDYTEHRNGKLFIHVKAQLTLRDGSIQTDPFPYPFVYAGDRYDPFVDANADQRSADGGVPVQLPPAGTDTSQYPTTVQVVLAHTNAAGLTTLPECPKR